MRVRVSRVVRGVVLLCLGVSYATIVIIWSTNGSQLAQHWTESQSRQCCPSLVDRVPRSIVDNDVESDRLERTHDSTLSSEQSVANSVPKNGNSTNQSNKWTQTSLSDIFISVKTTHIFHSSRLDLIVKTWFNLAKDQIFFFTDSNDSFYNEKSGGHLINTNCSSSHNRKALCCKMSVEFDTFIESNKKWFCHFDDDNYVNVPELVQLLRKYNPLEDWYLGKPSIRQPLEILNRHNKQKRLSFWFATGGAGFCLSRALALKMMPIASGGKFISIGEKIRLPDDVTIGYIIEYLLGKKLTVVENFHSHLEPMKFIPIDSLSQQISFSYSRYGHNMNVLSIDGQIDRRIDPTRHYIFSIHKELNIRANSAINNNYLYSCNRKFMRSHLLDSFEVIKTCLSFRSQSETIKETLLHIKKMKKNKFYCKTLNRITINVDQNL